MSEIVDDCAGCAYNAYRYEETKLQDLITADAPEARIIAQTARVDKARRRWDEVRPKADWEERIVAGFALGVPALPNAAGIRVDAVIKRRRLTHGQVAVLCVLAVIIAAVAGAVVGAMTA
ncbi:hypothetical protein H7J86_24420 [Mycobacterium hackensackense]|uniref:hypothetical protein n=1 Tax=Mycobacterium hackensackense TaxID=228909 RepID=UPI002265D20F|nr:hypothetical protein [Mycobacterium hackensackense]MCV7255313.1 hypothetical protein [Mycobacterium hackensackense]